MCSLFRKLVSPPHIKPVATLPCKILKLASPVRGLAERWTQRSSDVRQAATAILHRT